MSMNKRYLASFLLFILCTFSWAENFKAPQFNNLGNFHYAISTNNSSAQRFFDQGMILFYGFEWGESIRSFREAIRLDPTCAMCYWGLALAITYRINAPKDATLFNESKLAIKKGFSLRQNATTKERDLITTLYQRLMHSQSADETAHGFNCHKSQASNNGVIKKYITELKLLTLTYPDDYQIKVIYAAAIFWQLSHKEKWLDPNLQEAITNVQSVLAVDKNDIGANHYFIHLIEPHKRANEALESAHKLSFLVKGSEHLIHMPAHIYFLLGEYHLASIANQAAIKTYKAYNQTCLKQGFSPEINFLYFHNYDFLRSSATYEGKYKLAINSAQEMLGKPFNEWLKISKDLQWFIPIPYYVKARFGFWHEILNEKMPDKRYSYAQGMWHYVMGIAMVQNKNIKNAKQQLSELNNIILYSNRDDILNNEGLYLLEIARELLAAKIDSTLGYKNHALQHIKAAMKYENELGYHEPPDWYFPTQEALADFYLHWHETEKSIKMYLVTLENHPNNAWALNGIISAYKQLGRPKSAKTYEVKLKNVWKEADVKKPIPFF